MQPEDDNRRSIRRRLPALTSVSEPLDRSPRAGAARNRAHLRFYITMLIMLAAVAVIAALIWQENEDSVWHLSTSARAARAV